MFKKILFASFIFSFFCLPLFTGKLTTFGQVQQAEGRKCLQAKQVGGQTTTPPNPVQLDVTGKGLPSNTNVNVEFCQPSKDKTQCSMVGSTKTHGANLNATVSIGNLSGHVPYGLYGTWPKQQELVGGAGGDQQGTFTFDDLGKCVSITWDPFGRIFDSQSLEPIPSIKVAVFNSLNSTDFVQTLNNPQTVKEDGAFNFLVEPGAYYLNVLNLPTLYSFSSQPKLNPNYVKAYTKNDGSPSLYKPGEQIIEKTGQPEHRDIALDPGNNAPSHFLVVNIPGLYDQMVFGSMTKYGGKISHPLSIVALVGQKSHKEIARTAADKFGFWTVLLDNQKVPQDEPLVIKLIKVDLTTGKADERNARITSDVLFEPLVRILQGYTYDNNGVAVPYAAVSVVLDAKNDVYYQTTADQNGYFSISTQNLPILAYHVAVTTPKGNVATRIALANFVQQNKSYLTTNNINLMTETKTGDTTNAGIAGGKSRNGITPLSPSPSPTSTSDESLISKKIVAVIALVILVILAFVGSTFFLKGKKKSRPSRRRS